MTEAEIRLWLRLRRRQLRGLKFRRQHPIGPYIVDFACLSIRLAIEVDGATHVTEARQAHDRKRTTWLEQSGWQVVRIQNIWIYDDLDNVMDQIAETIGQRPGLPRGRGRCPEGTEGGSEDRHLTWPSPPQTLSPAGLKPSSPARGGARRDASKTEEHKLRPPQDPFLGTGEVSRRDGGGKRGQALHAAKPPQGDTFGED
ncbi:DUF559 domain-containing protein [Maricaulis sp.]|uniref:endonuclease domain-containing protein n=1 Tax=Maricaulis sp. TaxID=1486257 RepID=UPI00261189FA|nr:DUF559 domain-containing protein [Maricaulis sp.]